MAHESKGIIRKRVHKRIRRKVAGSTERPRLAVFRSVKHIYAQVIDDTVGHTLAAASSNEKSDRKSRTAAMWPAPRPSASCWPNAPRKKA